MAFDNQTKNEFKSEYRMMRQTSDNTQRYDRQAHHRGYI